MQKLAKKLLDLDLEWLHLGDCWYRVEYKNTSCHIEYDCRYGARLIVMTRDDIVIKGYASGFNYPILELWQTVNAKSKGEISKVMLIKRLLDD